MEKEARDKGAQEESRRAHGVGAEKGETGRGWAKRRERGLGMEKEARDKGAQEESRRAHGVGRRKEKQDEGGAE